MFYVSGATKIRKVDVKMKRMVPCYSLRKRRNAINSAGCMRIFWKIFTPWREKTQDICKSMTKPSTCLESRETQKRMREYRPPLFPPQFYSSNSSTVWRISRPLSLVGLHIWIVFSLGRLHFPRRWTQSSFWRRQPKASSIQPVP